MKTRHLSFLIFIALPSLVLPIGDRTDSEAAQDCQTIDRAKELIGQSDSKALQKSVESALPALKEGLERISQLLITKGIPQGDVEMFKKHVRELGFEPDKEIDMQKAEEFLKRAFPIFEVSLNDLRDFAPGKEANKLLSDTCQLLIPIEVDKEVRTSVTIRFIPGTQGEGDKKENGVGWRLTRWGLPKLIGQLTEKLPPKTRGILVSIPALNRNFLGYKDETDIKLVPLVPDRLFEKGTPLSAKEVFLRLVPEAESVDDGPR